MRMLFHAGSETGCGSAAGMNNSAGEKITISKTEHEKLIEESNELAKLKDNLNRSQKESKSKTEELEKTVISLRTENESITKKFSELESGIKQKYLSQLNDEHRKIAELIPTVEGISEYVKLNTQKPPAGSDYARPGSGAGDSINSKWDELTYAEKEDLRKKRPELWRKLYREKFGRDA